MRQIYLLASEADDAAAADVETLLRQRGYIVRRAEEKFAYPPARQGEITVALWSKAVQFSSKQILFTNRAIDAWTEGRLILARLDHVVHPRGLGDVEAIDLSFAPARTASVWKIVEAAQEIDRAMNARQSELPAPQAPSPGSGGEGASGIDDRDVREDRAPRVGRKRPSESRAFAPLPAVIVGLVVAAALGSAGFLAMPFASTYLLGAAALAWGAVAGAYTGHLAGGREILKSKSKVPAASAPPPAAEAEAPPLGDSVSNSDETASVFVSYSRSNSALVYPLVDQVEAGGRNVWIDRDGIEAGGNWAGLIVRAIRESETFCLMCSAEAFQSDNVRREIYIADKYKRKLLPVRLDGAEMPEDFEYFLIDRQWLDLSSAAPEERAVRLMAALAR